MSRRQAAGFVAFFVLLAAGFGVGAWRSRPAGADVPALRAAAALAPCPSGLGPALPDLTLACLGGGPAVRLRGAPGGRPTLVNVWATWCGPCVQEGPELAGFAAAAAGRVDVVGVATEEDSAAGPLRFAREHGAHYPHLLDDDGRVMRAYGPGPPITLFLDAAGRLVFTRVGLFTSQQQLRSLVAEHLGVRL